MVQKLKTEEVKQQYRNIFLQYVNTTLIKAGNEIKKFLEIQNNQDEGAVILYLKQRVDDYTQALLDWKQFEAAKKYHDAGEQDIITWAKDFCSDFSKALGNGALRNFQQPNIGQILVDGEDLKRRAGHNEYFTKVLAAYDKSILESE